ncbi:MAG: 16S rRNA (uracil(1498)-N(3))-methyltransferase [Clostridia bacterium]|nr:16S rRNA (uracil(1498)-N(3))-methyltransferase [Clostridia bacterium]
MPRFFINKEDISGSIATVTGDDARHIARSLRMAVGDGITLADGSGKEYLATLTKIRDEVCEASITEVRDSESEPPSRITLFMAYPKSDKLETVIQKAVELGARGIVPFESERCIKRPDALKAAARCLRHERIAAEAAKQCGRAILPTVSVPISFTEMLDSAAGHTLVLFCYEGEGAQSLRAILSEYESAPESIAVIVGSEGGFSPAEAEAARARGFKIANLGGRILRCETAPDYVLSALSYHFELKNR